MQNQKDLVNTTSDQISLGKRVRSLRMIQRISVPELSRRSGLAKPLIHQIESGRERCLSNTIVALCNSLEVSSDYLLGIHPQQELLDALIIHKEILYKAKTFED